MQKGAGPKGKTWPLVGKIVSLGSGPENSIRILDGAVSAKHAGVSIDGNKFEIVDLNSKKTAEFEYPFELLPKGFGAIRVLSPAFGVPGGDYAVQMVLVELFVMIFEVMFLYRELVDAITPWIAQQTGEKFRPGISLAICVAILTVRAQGQNRGVYPLGMSALNSGITPQPGFTYSNQLLFYSRDQAKSDDGSTLPVAGSNSVLMDMNSFIWVSRKNILNGAHYSAIATLPVAKNDLTSDVLGNITGGSGFADSYYVPLVLGWNKERVALRVHRAGEHHG